MTDTFTVSGNIACTDVQSTVVNLTSASAPAVTGTDIALFTTGGLGIATNVGSSELLTAGLTAVRTYVMPDVSDILVDTSSAQTLTNKTISGISVATIAGVTISGTPSANESIIASSSSAAAWKYTGAMASMWMNLSSSSTTFTNIGGYIVYKNPTATTTFAAAYANVTCVAGVTGVVRIFNPSTGLAIAQANVSSAATLYTLTVNTANIPAGVTPVIWRWQVQRTSVTSGNITSLSLTMVY